MAGGTRFQQKRTTASEWTRLNPILAAGEIGVETDTGVVKIGTWRLGRHFYIRKGFIDARLSGLLTRCDVLTYFDAVVFPQPQVSSPVGAVVLRTINSPR